MIFKPYFKDIDTFTIPGYYTLKGTITADILQIPTTDGIHVFVPEMPIVRRKKK